MRDDRAQVLKQIRAALQTAHLPAARAIVPPRVNIEQGSRAEMPTNFQRELEAVGGACYMASNPADAIATTLKLLRETDNQEILTWDDAALPVDGLSQALRANGYTRKIVDVPTEGAARQAKLAELERTGAGITGALAGLMDTGSVVLVTQPRQARLISLLPSLHIALLPVSRLYATMATFFAAHPDVTQRGSNLVFITGPSRTADIELTLTRGVHGPKYIHVLLLTWC
ncbi:MAG: Lactate utilization protein C [Anaerolineae bacterium]|nr:Lactate utilization protein C [Anaerolineae bacterium]